MEKFMISTVVFALLSIAFLVLWLLNKGKCVKCADCPGCPGCPRCPECPGCPPPTECPKLPELQLIDQNNGSVTCDQYCNGHWGKQTLPASWKGASDFFPVNPGENNIIGQNGCLCIRQDDRPFTS